jgi:tetratricopeptide (TPR) repeat protein
MRIWSSSVYLLLVLSHVPLAAQPENRDGLLPPVSLDRSAGVTPIRQAIAARDLTLAQTKTEELCLREPGTSEPLLWAGYVALGQGKFYDAIRYLRRAESLDPNVFVLKLLAVSYYAAHQPRLFLLKIRAAQQKQPDDFAPYYYLGRYFDSDLGDFSQAVDNFKRALARQPDHFHSHYYLGQCYETEGEAERAEVEYRRALELAERQRAADIGLPYQGLARLRLSSQRPAEALQFAKRAAELLPRDATSHKLLAKTYLELGQNAESAAEWEITGELDPTDASPQYRLYRIYLASGDAEKARSALARYKQIAASYGTN